MVLSVPVKSVATRVTGISLSAYQDTLTFPFMADAATDVQRNADANWNRFSSDDYWRRNYHELQAEDQEIIRLVSRFFIRAFAGRPPARRSVDVGSGTNLYPALLMLPWAEQILLTDFSASNVDWLRRQLDDELYRRHRAISIRVESRRWGGPNARKNGCSDNQI